MNFSTNKYTLTSPHPIPEIAEKLYSNTLIRRTLMREKTEKQFIGEVSEDDFYLIGSSRGGVVCTLNGEFKTEGPNTVIKLETKLHRAFVILFSCWAALIIATPIISYMVNPRASGFSIGQLPILLLAVVAARALLHFVYTRARNRSINQMEELIA